MSNSSVVAVALVSLSLIAAGAAPSAAQQFPLRSGDLVVMLGDSITRQHLHTNYIELYCLTRFPNLGLRFRNSGVGGDTVPRAIARLDWDVLAWRPDVVTIELGMNDAGGGPAHVRAYTDQMRDLVNRIQRAGVRTIVLTASPVNDGSTMDNLHQRNVTLDKMATAAVELARREKVPSADQFHALLDIWGRNMAAKGVDLGGNPVHPGPVGQLTMAWACLKGLGAPALVSSVTVDAAQGQVVETRRCQVKKLTIDEKGISFIRIDEAMPWPIPENAMPGCQLVPVIDDLNQYLLRVVGLPDGDYEVKTDGETIGVVPAGQLAAGWNVGTPHAGPIWVQCQDAIKYVEIKSKLVTRWREVSGFRIPEWLAGVGVEQRQAAELKARREAVEEMDGQIRDACQPRPHRWQIVPVQ